MRSFQNRVRHQRGHIRPALGGRLAKEKERTRQAAACRLGSAGMFLGMFERGVGVVVVHRAVVFVVVAHAFIMVEHVHERRHPGCRRHGALHGETIQGQAEQHEDVKDPAQVSVQSMCSEYNIGGAGDGFAWPTLCRRHSFSSALSIP